MSYLGKFNHFMYKKSLSLFDITWISLISMLAVDYSAWYFLLMLPFSWLSELMQQRHG